MFWVSYNNQISIMGIGTIVQKNVSSGFSSLWGKVPNLPSLSINTDQYNKSFVNFAIFVGAVTVIKSGLYLGKKSIDLLKGCPQLPSSKKLQEKYGQHSWVLIVDCKRNQQYCSLFVKNGFNLILCGQEEEIKIVEDQIRTQAEQNSVKIHPRIIDWSQQATNLKFYQEFVKQLKDFDISFMVMPKIGQEGGDSMTFCDTVPKFEHIFLMVRYFGEKLRWRSYMSGIIIPSSEQVDKVIQLNGVLRAVQSGVDGFGRTVGYELNGTIEVVVARGSAKNAVAGLGKIRITH